MVGFRNIVNRTAKRIRLFFRERSLSTFCLFLLFATILWFGHALNAVRERTVSIPVEYTGVPAEVAFSEALPTEFVITIRDQGKRLRNYRSGSFSAIQIDLSQQTDKRQGEVVLNAEQIRPKLSDQLQGTAKLQRIRPENIAVTYYRQVSKTVPIRFAGKVVPATQYQLTAAPTIVPQEVSVYGAAEQLDTLLYVSTVAKDFQDVKDTLQTSLPLAVPAGIRTGTTTAVELTAVTEQYTEKKFTLPLATLGVPKGLRLRTFPSSVEVTVRVGISRFAEVTASDLTAGCFFPTEETTLLPVKLSYMTPYITNIRCTPSEVEFIIEREL